MPIRNLQTVYDGDRVCCLMFDEVSIRGNLHFNQKFGCIEGFEDLGNQGKARQGMLQSRPGLLAQWSLLKVEATSSLLLDSQKQ